MANQSTNPSESGQSSKSQEAQRTSPQPAQQSGGQLSTQRGGAQQSSGRLARREPSGSFGFWGMSPFTVMRRMLEDMDRLFEDTGPARLSPSGGRDLQRQQGGELWAPRVDVFERDGRLVVRADLPGLRKEDVRVEVTNDAITIEGERRQEHELEERGGVYRSELSYGSFYRAIPLPEGANAEGAEARFADGVLEVTVPLEHQRGEAKRIQIQDAEPRTDVH